MAVRLNRRAFEHASRLIDEGKYAADSRDDWSEALPSAAEENAFIAEFGFGEYAKWYLGINDEYPEDRKGRYEFPYGDFRVVHRGGVLTVESRAAQYKHVDIERAAAELHGKIDNIKHHPV